MLTLLHQAIKFAGAAAKRGWRCQHINHPLLALRYRPRGLCPLTTQQRWPSQQLIVVLSATTGTRWTSQLAWFGNLIFLKAKRADSVELAPRAVAQHPKQSATVRVHAARRSHLRPDLARAHQKFNIGHRHGDARASVPWPIRRPRRSR